MNHEELEKWEKAVKTIHAFHHPNFMDIPQEMQRRLDAKLIYYLKTGITLKGIEKRAAITANKEKDKLRALGFKVKPNIKIK